MQATNKAHLGTPFLTEGYADPELCRQIKQTSPGMAHWSASGPFGTCCKDCRFFGYWRTIKNSAGDSIKTIFHRSACGKFLALTGRHGPPIEPGTESCRYFERRSASDRHSR
jgi:hypothetical protein